MSGTSETVFPRKYFGASNTAEEVSKVSDGEMAGPERRSLLTQPVTLAATIVVILVLQQP